MKDSQENINSSQPIVKYWQIIVFVLTVSVGFIIGYTNIKNQVINSEALARNTCEIVKEHDRQLTGHRVELSNIKESLRKIENQNDKIQDKIDRIFEKMNCEKK